MSRNPYFAHLPTWRNRQDLSYALDQLPRILETMTASAPLLATISYPLSSGSSPSSSNPSRSSTPAPISSYSSSTSSPSRSCTPQPQTTVAALPCVTSKVASPSAFRERFMMDLTREYQRRSTSPCTSSSSSSRCSSPSSSPVTTAATPFNFPPPSSSSSRSASPAPSRRPSQQQQQQQQRRNGCPSSDAQSSSSLPEGGYYPVQFSTRARAMSFLIEILQSLQKEPCSCDLLKGCSCGPDGYEDHEGRSPCYVCGEWFLDRQDQSRNRSNRGEHRDDLGGGVAATTGVWGRAWHEQGSLRHHVAEARVKKWLDSVWRPPLTPATTPEQETIKQFMAISTVTAMARTASRAQETQQDWHNQPQHPPLYRLAADQQDQSSLARMDPMDRPWGIHDIEIEARVKSRSRQNSASSSFSPIASSSWSPALPLSSTPCGTTAGLASSSPFASTTSVSSSSFSPFLPSCHPLMDRRHSTPRARAQSGSDESPSVFTSPSPATTTTTTTVVTPHPSHPGSLRDRNNGPLLGRANTAPPSSSSGSSVFVIPQEILDPSYRSPTFRIKSWNPPPPDSPSPSFAFSPPRSLPLREDLTESTLSNTKIKSEGLSSIVKSSLMDSSDRLQVQQQPQQQPQSRQQQQREQQPLQEPFKFHFTSQRFHAAIEEATRKSTVSTPTATASASDSQVSDYFSVSCSTKDRTPKVRRRRAPRKSLPHGTVEVIWQEEVVREVRDVEKSTGYQMDIDTMADPTTTTTTTNNSNININNNSSTSASSSNNNSNIHSGASTIQKSAPLSPRDSENKSPSTSTATSNPLMRYRVFNKSHLSFSISAQSFKKSSTGKKQSSLVSPPISPLSSSSSTTSDVTGSPSSPSMEQQQQQQRQGQGQKQISYKAASWSSLHRLVLKMTKNGDGAGSLQRRGRMHLDGP